MKSIKILVIGSNGLLGSEITKYLNKKKINFLTVARNNSDFNLDLKRFKKLNYFFENNNFNIVINCAAKVSIDFCEQNFKEALTINYYFPKYLSLVSKKFKFKLVQISTDHVYSGNKFKLNNEKSKTYSINNYTKTKILAENAIKKIKNYLIIRTNFTGRKFKKDRSFSDWINNSILKKKNIKLFTDMYTSTIDVKNCAKLLVKLAIKKSSGIYNLGRKDVLSKKEFALKFSKKIKKKIKFKDVSCETLLVKRGKKLGLNVNKIEKKLGIKMPNSNRVIYNLVNEYK